MLLEDLERDRFLVAQQAQEQVNGRDVFVVEPFGLLGIIAVSAVSDETPVCAARLCGASVRRAVKSLLEGERPRVSSKPGASEF